MRSYLVAIMHRPPDFAPLVYCALHGVFRGGALCSESCVWDMGLVDASLCATRCVMLPLRMDCVLEVANFRMDVGLANLAR